MYKDIFNYISLSSLIARIVLTSVITESLNKSTFNACKANVSKYNEACIQVLKTGSSFQQKQVLNILAINELKDI